MREQMMHLVSSFWLPLPFLTRREVNRDDQKAELWFLVTLHSAENFVGLLVSRSAYNSYPLGQLIIHFVVIINIFAVFFSFINFKSFKVWSFALLLTCLVGFNVLAAFLVKALVQDFDQGLFVIDLCLVILNVLSCLLVVIFQQKFALFAGLPQNLPDLPSFGLEVISLKDTIS